MRFVVSIIKEGGTHLLKRTLIGDALWGLALLIITALLLIPQTQEVFTHLTNSFPYLMGFIKFAILATIGELLALRLANGAWMRPDGMVYKILVWGLIGVLITYMFAFYSKGSSAMMEQARISPEDSFLSTVFTAFLTSVIMNLTFGIVFMAMHRMSDTYIEMRINHKKPSLKELIEAIDWDAFFTFVVFKTIPFFWIPAHTVTFTLPSQYRVVVAAYLSIILGVILAYSSINLKQKT
jgi:hypothetical protein